MMDGTRAYFAGTIFAPNSGCVYGATNRNYNYIGMVLEDVAEPNPRDRKRNYQFGAVQFDLTDAELVVTSLDVTHFEKVNPTIELINKFRDFVNSSVYDVYPAYREKILSFLLLHEDALSGKEEVVTVTEEKEYSLDLRVKADEKLVKEMIAQVDKDRFKKMLAICGSNGDRKKMPIAKVVDDYLDRWARCKAPYFKLFGNKLTLDTDIDYQIDEKEMLALINALKLKYPQYYFMLNAFSVSEYINNAVAPRGEGGRNADSYRLYFGKFYQDGMKLTKFFTNLIDDKTFHDDLSMMLTSNTIKGKVVVSIDPYDYLTMSVNKHGWESCHRIDGGGWGTGPLSYMCDEATLIAYKHNNRNYRYDIYGFMFEGNSKSWRQAVYFDPATCSMIFSRQYADPRSMDELCTVTRNMLEKKISEHFEIPDVWTKAKNKYQGNYEDMSSYHYSDIQNFSHLSYNYYFVKHKHLQKTANISFHVGSTVRCIYCGEDVDGTEESTCGCC